MDTARAWELKEAYRRFWKHMLVLCAGGLLDSWCDCLHWYLDPMQAVARTE